MAAGFPHLNPSRRLAFICNDRAGSGLRFAALDNVVEELQRRGFEIRQYPCQESPEATASQALREGYNVVVAVGGDGTVSGCAAAVWKHGGDATLAVVPAGTLNHFARDLGVPDLNTALRAMSSGHIRKVDLATVNGIPFVNNSGIGLYPVIVRKRESSRHAGVPRWIAFALAICDVFLHLPLRRLRLEADGKRLAHRTPFLFVGNNSYRVQGIDIGTRQALDCGVLGICTSSAPGRLALLRLALRALFGRIRREHDFLNITAHSLIVRSRHSAIQVSLDGELKRLRMPLNYQALPGALPVLVPLP